MFDFNDSNDIEKFKERLKTIRREKGFTQTSFAEALHDNDRSRVANWESKKSPTIPKVYDFPTLCRLLDVDPNYLLDVSEDKSASDKNIGEKINISADNVNMLRNNPHIGNFIDFLLSSDKLENLLYRIRRASIYGYFSKSLDTTFSTDAISKLQSAFNLFYQKVFPLDMNVNAFTAYVENAFPWNPNTQSFTELLHSIVIDERYYSMLENNPDFMVLTEEDKYYALMYDVAKASFDYLMGGPAIELAEQGIGQAFLDIAKEYISADVSNFKKQHLQNL